MVEWLWDVRKKITKAEYFVALSTFALIQILGVEKGIFAGCFIFILLLKLGFNVGEIQVSKQRTNEPSVKTIVESKYGGVDKCCSTDFENSTETWSWGEPAAHRRRTRTLIVSHC